MAVQFPILQIPVIAEPCNQSWEHMPGSARVRHCVSCDQDVVNLAAMSSAEIAVLLQGPVPCLRVARQDDGSLVTLEPPTLRSLPRVAAGFLTAALSVGTAAAQQPTPQLPPPPQPAAQQQQTQRGVTMGAPPPVSQADPAAHPAPAQPTRPAPQAIMGKIAPLKPLPRPAAATPARKSTLMGRVAVHQTPGTIPREPAPKPLLDTPRENPLPQK